MTMLRRLAPLPLALSFLAALLAGAGQEEATAAGGPQSLACTSCLKIRNATDSQANLSVAKDGPYALADSRTPKGTLGLGGVTSSSPLYWADAGGFYLFPGQIAYVRNEATNVTTGPIRSDGWKRLSDENVTKTVTLIY